jgi:hypothetical protein
MIAAEIAAAEAAGDNERILRARSARYDEDRTDGDNVGKLLQLAERTGRIREYEAFGRSLADTHFTNLFTAMPLIKLGLALRDFTWARRMVDIAEGANPGDEWPPILRAQLEAASGDPSAGLSVLRRAMPSLGGHWAYLNVSDQYYAIASGMYAAYVNTRAPTRSDGPPLPDALFVTLVKDEEDVIYANLSHHFRQGFRNFVAIDNNSSDQTASELKRFEHDHPDATLFVIHDPITGYVQDAKTIGAAHFAATVLAGMQRPIRWVFPVDADEFICVPAHSPSLSETLRRVEADGADTMPIVQINASTPRPEPRLPTGGDVLAAFSRRMPYPWIPVFKVAARYAPNLTFDVGNHRPGRPFGAELRVCPASRFGIYMLHLPLRSLAQVRSKILNGIRALNAAPHLVGLGGHWRRWSDQYDAEGEAFIERLLRDYVADITEKDSAR